MIFVEELCCLKEFIWTYFTQLSCYIWLRGILINVAFVSLTSPTDAVEKGKNNVNYMNNFLEAMLFWEKSEGEKKVRKHWYF